MTIFESLKDFVKGWVQKLSDMLSNSGKTTKEITPEVEARLRTQKLLDYDKGLHISYLEKLIGQQFKSGRFQSELMAQPQIRNIVTYLADTVPATFRDGVLVQASTDRDQRILDEILDDNKFDNFCRTLDRTVYLTKTCFVKVNYREETLALDIITPEYCQVEAAELNPYRIKTIGYPHKLVTKNVMKPKGIFCVWTENTFWFVDEDGKILPNAENVDNINPYGIIPIVTFRENEPMGNEFWNWPPESLVNAQDNLNVKLTYRNYLFRRFNIPIPVLLGGAGFENGQYPIVDGSTVLQIKGDFENPNSKFEFVIPGTKMDEVLSVINEEIRAIFISQGIDPNLLMEYHDRQSGLSVQMMNGKLEERRAVAKLAYQYSLEELFEVMRVVWNTHNPNNMLSDGEIEIKIPEPRPGYSSAADKWADFNEKLRLNLITAADILLLERNDLLNRGEAEAIIAENSKKNRSMKLSALLANKVAMGAQPKWNSSASPESPGEDNERKS